MNVRYNIFHHSIVLQIEIKKKVGLSCGQKQTLTQVKKFGVPVLPTNHHHQNLNPIFPRGVEMEVSEPRENPNPRKFAATWVVLMEAPVFRFGLISATAGPALIPALKRLASAPMLAPAIGV